MSVSMYGQKSSVYRPQASRRAPAHRWNPMEELSTALEYRVWEASKIIADQLAPDEPADMEPLEDHDQWMLLEHVALNLSPQAWDDPNAINALYDLRKRFAPALATPDLKVLAHLKKTEKGLLPDPSVTPESPEWTKQKNRLAR